VRNPIIAALDVESADKALKLARDIGPSVGAFKVGSELFTSAGPEIVRELRRAGASVFLDLKFHDIPNTVAKAVAAATRLNVQMLTIHTSGGGEMMRVARESATKAAKDCGWEAPLLLGVTVLTSMDADRLAEVGYQRDVFAQVERLARLAVDAGLSGLVCSPVEIAGLRKVLPSHVQLVTPGIRAGTETGDDQRRTLTAREALNAGADWLVVGRPIYSATNPQESARIILSSLG
jgi:orotidine-5'-phosphate decarboxylase